MHGKVRGLITGLVVEFGNLADDGKANFLEPALCSVHGLRHGICRALLQILHHACLCVADIDATMIREWCDTKTK